MKQRLYLGTVLSLLLFLLGSCKDDYTEGTGKGKLNLNIALSDKVQSVTKADTENTWNPSDDCLISISSQAGIIQKYEGLNDLPEELWLVSGNYSVRVTAGDSILAGFNSPYYKGEESFTISSGEVKNTTVTCNLANTLVTPFYSEELKANLTSYTLTVYNVRTTGELVFNATHEGIPGYFMMSQTNKDLYWTFDGETTDGEKFSKSDVLSNVKSRTNYKMNFHFDPSYSDGGGIMVGIEVEELSDEPNEDDVVTIIMPPSVTGHGFDINNTVLRPEGSMEDIKIWINGSSELKSVLFSMDASTQQIFGLPSTQFDFVKMDSSMKEQFATDYKIECKEKAEDTNGDGKEDVWRMLITIAGETMESLENKDKFSFTISVEDANGYTKEKVLSVEITDAIVGTEDVDDYTVWTNRATLKGVVIAPTEETIMFQYKKITDLIYEVVNANMNGDSFTAEIQNLEPGTTYEFRAMAGSSFGDTKYFTTEQAAQLPNSSFEDWTEKSGLTGRAWVVYKGDKSNMFWDTGNHGGTTSSLVYANLTTPSTENVSSGTYSAELNSQHVGTSTMGRFAAGNLFVGEYKETIQEGSFDFKTAGGRIDFGREFTSRPAKVKFSYRYTGGTINYVQPDPKIPIPDELIADGAELNKPDKANIYVALTDAGEPYTIINTSARNSVWKFFDKNDPSIIAYKEWEQASSTDVMQDVILELDYRSLERKPTHIIIVCSASKYGDYFTGSSGSTLWLDDFELIYE